LPITDNTHTPLISYSFFSTTPPPPTPPLFPYTTLFRSRTTLPQVRHGGLRHVEVAVQVRVDRPIEVLERDILDALRVLHMAKARSEEHTSELQSQSNLVCRLLLEKKKKKKNIIRDTLLC